MKEIFIHQPTIARGPVRVSAILFALSAMLFAGGAWGQVMRVDLVEFTSGFFGQCLFGGRRCNCGRQCDQQAGVSALGSRHGSGRFR